MNIARVSKFSIQRRLLLRCLGLRSNGVADSSCCLGQQPAGIVRRRHLATESKHEQHSNYIKTTATGGNIEESKIEERKLEEYTAYLLNSHLVPLGTMNRMQRDDLVAAVEFWMTRMGNNGYAIDTAGRLLDRFIHEQKANSRSFSTLQSLSTIVELRRSLLGSWIELHKRNSESHFALEQADKILFEILEDEPVASNVDSFPVDEFLSVIEGWLRVQPTSIGSKRAANLLLSNTNRKFHSHFKGHSNRIVPLFHKTLSRALSHDEKVDEKRSTPFSAQLLGRMEFLKFTALWEGLELTEEDQMALGKANLRIPLTSPAESMQGEKDSNSLSSFEAQAVQKRMIDILRGSNAVDEEVIMRLLPRIEAIAEPTNELLWCLIDFFLRAGEVERASQWLFRLPLEEVMHQVPTVAISEHLSASETTDQASLSLFDRTLDSWATNTHPRAPWRAEEMFRYVLEHSEGNHTMSVDTINRLLKTWSTSSDPVASRKVREWLSYMTESMSMRPNGTTLKLLLDAVNRNNEFAKVVFSTLSKEREDLSDKERREISATLTQVLTNSSFPSGVVLFLLELLGNDISDLSSRKYDTLVQNVFSNASDLSSVMDLVQMLENYEKQFEFSTYQCAIQSLLRHEREHLDKAETLWKRSFERMKQDDSQAPKGTEIAEYLCAVIRMYTSRKYYGEAEKLLETAERTLFVEPFSKEGHSIIPLEAYRLMIKRSWYVSKSAHRVIKTYERLFSLYNSGFQNLKPDQDLFSAHMRAQATILNDPADIEGFLDDMLDFFHDSLDTNDATAFNTVLLAYGKSKDNGILVCEKSLTLLERMSGLGFSPDSKTISIAIDNILKYDQSPKSFKTVVKLYSRFSELRLEPDTRSLHYLMVSCGRVRSKNDRNEAITVCLKALGEIRKRNETSRFTYATLTKSLRHLLRSGPVADKVASSTLRLCMEDGLLGPRVKDAFKAIMSDGAWKEVYLDRLLNDEEPKEWNRRLVANDTGTDLTSK